MDGMKLLLLSLGVLGIVSTASLAAADVDATPRRDSGGGSDGGGGCRATAGLGEGAMVFGVLGALGVLAARRR